MSTSKRKTSGESNSPPAAKVRRPTPFPMARPVFLPRSNISPRLNRVSKGNQVIPGFSEQSSHHHDNAVIGELKKVNQNIRIIRFYVDDLNAMKKENPGNLLKAFTELNEELDVLIVHLDGMQPMMVNVRLNEIYRKCMTDALNLARNVKEVIENITSRHEHLGRKSLKSNWLDKMKNIGNWISTLRALGNKSPRKMQRASTSSKKSPQKSQRRNSQNCPRRSSKKSSGRRMSKRISQQSKRSTNIAQNGTDESLKILEKINSQQVEKQSPRRTSQQGESQSAKRNSQQAKRQSPRRNLQQAENHLAKRNWLQTITETFKRQDQRETQKKRKENMRNRRIVRWNVRRALLCK